MFSPLPKLRQEYLKNENELSEVMGIVNISKSHFISFVVDFKEKLVVTFVQYINALNNQGHEARKWKAKTLSLSFFLLVEIFIRTRN